MNKIQEKKLFLGIVPSPVIKENEIKGKSIFNKGVVRYLVKRGHRIIDIKPDKKSTNKEKTIHIFELTDSLEADLALLSIKHKNDI